MYFANQEGTSACVLFPKRALKVKDMFWLQGGHSSVLPAEHFSTPVNNLATKGAKLCRSDLKNKSVSLCALDNNKTSYQI